MEFLPLSSSSSFCNILLLTRYGSAYPLCTDSRSPFVPKSPLAFCQYSGRACCNSTEDVELQKQFKSLNVSGYGCASLLKSTICSRCDPFSAELYRTGSAPRVVPVLCNSTVSSKLIPVPPCCNRLLLKSLG
ncbi:hypothetical protein OIU85_007527 [Salix viminalis]|uniref:Uncharacterized protein n=1 Tax=Salix viminalis TaxID=40686 RepID=A0A9Q0SN34_SALVM|nr:hypothetical protein OIU85_007527 [Salix viminalis]